MLYIYLIIFVFVSKTINFLLIQNNVSKDVCNDSWLLHFIIILETACPTYEPLKWTIVVFVPSQTI